MAIIVGSKDFGVCITWVVLDLRAPSFSTRLSEARTGMSRYARDRELENKSEIHRAY